MPDRPEPSSPSPLRIAFGLRFASAGAMSVLATRVAVVSLAAICGAAGVAVAGMHAAARGEGSGELGSCKAGKIERFTLSGAFDESSGRDHRHWPPDRIVDHLQMTLELRFDDLAARRFEGVQTLRVRGLATSATAIGLDAVDLLIEDVQRDGSSTGWHHDGSRLTILLDPPLPRGDETALRIRYACVDPVAGMTFSPADPDRMHAGPQVHTQGQPETSRHWFPCHDFPNERLSTELIVDVPSGFVASSNGRLVDQRDADGRSVWHWRQARPHVNYLVTLVIGRFDRVDLAPAGRNAVPMTVWVPPGVAERVERTYGRTGAMLELFEELFDFPYPWDRYDQLVVRNFGAGGMENTAATTMYPTAIFSERAMLDADLDGLIAHELAHQWFGNLLTCRSWAHLWLNEGWATYSSALWRERLEGEDGYLASIRGSMGVAERDRSPTAPAMVSNEYGTPIETFRRIANPYTKGASILHMLRRRLGEEAFWRGVRLYVARHADTAVETDDFRHALEEASGLDLEWFFHQWCHRAGTPQLVVDLRLDPQRDELTVTVEQTQPIDARNPAYRFDLPILIRVEGVDRTVAIPVHERRTVWTGSVGGLPELLVVDPHLDVLKSARVSMPRPLRIAQALHAPTISARIDAIEGLREDDRPEVVEALLAIAADADRRHQERAPAVRALAQFGSADAHAALGTLIADLPTDARVRIAVVDELWRRDRGEALPILVRVADEDRSYACRAAAIAGLARFEATEHADLIHSLLEHESQHDQVRNAALDALASLDDPRTLDAGLRYGRLGKPDRARPRAIAAVGRSAHHDPDRALETLVRWLDDPERTTTIAAGDAIAAIIERRVEVDADPAIRRIRTMARNDRDDRVRRAAERWLARIDAVNLTPITAGG